MNDNPPIDRLLTLRQVMDVTGYGKTMIYRMMRDGRFPAQRKPFGSSSRWSESEVRAWREGLDDTRAAA